jgi:hypothetical protein
MEKALAWVLKGVDVKTARHYIKGNTYDISWAEFWDYYHDEELNKKCIHPDTVIISRLQEKGVEHAKEVLGLINVDERIEFINNFLWKNKNEDNQIRE